MCHDMCCHLRKKLIRLRFCVQSKTKTKERPQAHLFCLGCYDTQQSVNRQNDNQKNVTQENDAQKNITEQNITHHNVTQLNDTEENFTKQDDIEKNDT